MLTLLRTLVPRAARIEVARLRRAPAFWLERSSMARGRASPVDDAASRFELAAHDSPLERVPGQVPPHLQAGKEHNVALAAGLLDGIAIRSGRTFSYHHAVGRPSRLRGFRAGLELHDGQARAGVGGGCCAVSNLLYLPALRAGLKIVERHRHGLDLFPDHGRTVPFGCGATVFYNRADLRFENPFPFPVILRLAQVVALLEAASFERVAVRRLVLPERRWIEEGESLTGHAGLPRRRLAPRFCDLSDADRRTAAAHYLFRRPALRRL